MPDTATGRQPAASPTAKVRDTAVALFTVMPSGPFTYDVAVPTGIAPAAAPIMRVLVAEVVRIPSESTSEALETPGTSRLPPATTTPAGLAMLTTSTTREAGISKPVVRAVVSGA